MIEYLKKLNPFKRSLESILASFQKTITELNSFASKKADEALVKENKAAALMKEVEAADLAAEQALNTAEKLSKLINGTPASL